MHTDTRNCIFTAVTSLKIPLENFETLLKLRNFFALDVIFLPMNTFFVAMCALYCRASSVLLDFKVFF